jgi:hypothetical protein
VQLERAHHVLGIVGREARRDPLADLSPRLLGGQRPGRHAHVPAVVEPVAGELLAEDGLRLLCRLHDARTQIRGLAELARRRRRGLHQHEQQGDDRDPHGSRI